MRPESGATKPPKPPDSGNAVGLKRGGYSTRPPPLPSTRGFFMGGYWGIMAGMGRPTSYNQELADTICQRLAGGESLRAICRDEEYPHISTVLLWVVQDREQFSEQYMQAREAAGFAHADRVADIALVAAEEGIDPQAARAAMDGLKWAAERMSPKRHSQRQEIDHTTGGDKMQPHRIELVAPDDNSQD